MLTPPTPPDETRRLDALRALRLLDTPREERFDRITRTAARLFGVPIALVSLVDVNRQWFKSCLGLDAAETPRSVSFCAHAILEEGPLVVPDARADARFADNPLVLEPPHIRSYVGQPLRTPDGSRIGTLCLIDRVARTWAPAQLAALRDLAAWAEVEIALTPLADARGLLVQHDAFFEATADLAAILRPSGAPLRLSRSWETVLGVPRAALLREPPLARVHPEDRARLLTAMRAARSAGAAELELRALHADGTEVWLHGSVRCGPGRDGADGAAAGDGAAAADGAAFHLVARDVTRQKALEAERAQVERMKAEFVSTVSHELRTPLTSIRGALGLLSGGVLGELPAEARPVVDVALRSCERLGRLVNDILDLERLEGGRLDFHLAPQALAPLVEQAVEAARPQARAKGVGLELAVAPEAADAVAQVDADRLLQVLANLLSNALKFTPAGRRVHARLVLAPGGAGAQLRVEDEGPGIPPDFAPRLFQRFAQAGTREAPAHGGSGLGLAISRALVQGMGGSLTHEGPPGGGAHFVAALPLLLTPDAPPWREPVR